MKRMMLLLAALIMVINVAYAAKPKCKDNPLYCPWLIYFNNQGKQSDFQKYDPIVFDANRHPDLCDLRKVKNLLGCLSFASVTTTSPYFNSAVKAGVVIAPIANNPGSWYVDIRKPYWRDLIIKQLIPALLQEGFKGVFIDYLDYAIYLEQTNPPVYAGMTQAAVNLIKAVRNAYPKMPLMMNNAYQILDKVGGWLDFALGSSLLTTYNPDTQRYEYVPLRTYQTNVDYLQKARALYPKLIVMSLDYWNPADTFTITNIYNQEYKNGFRPYVTAAGLQSITPAP